MVGTGQHSLPDAPWPSRSSASEAERIERERRTRAFGVFGCANCAARSHSLIHQAAVNMEMRHVHAYHQVCSSVVLHTTRIMQLATHTRPRLCVCGVCDKNLPNAMSSRANVDRRARVPAGVRHI